MTIKIFGPETPARCKLLGVVCFVVFVVWLILVVGCKEKAVSTTADGRNENEQFAIEHLDRINFGGIIGF